MSRPSKAERVLSRLQQEREELATRTADLQAQIDDIAARLEELNVIVPALEAQVGGKAPAAAPARKAPAKKATTRKTAAKKTTTRKTATRKAAPKAAAPAAPAAEAKPAAKKAAPKKAAPKKAAPKKAAASRKGRRKATGAKGVHAMGIVDAAIHLAKEHGKREVDAGDVLGWFEEIGYKTRRGVPNRNSIYVSLNREASEGKKKGRNRIERVGKGEFVFHEVPAAS